MYHYLTLDCAGNRCRGVVRAPTQKEAARLLLNVFSALITLEQA